MTEYDSSESSLDDSRGNVDRSNFVTDEGNGITSCVINNNCEIGDYLALIGNLNTGLIYFVSSLLYSLLYLIGYNFQSLTPRNIQITHAIVNYIYENKNNLSNKVLLECNYSIYFLIVIITNLMLFKSCFAFICFYFDYKNISFSGLICIHCFTMNVKSSRVKVYMNNGVLLIFC